MKAQYGLCFISDVYKTIAFVIVYMQKSHTNTYTALNVAIFCTLEKHKNRNETSERGADHGRTAHRQTDKRTTSVCDFGRFSLQTFSNSMLLRMCCVILCCIWRCMHGNFSVLLNY